MIIFYPIEDFFLMIVYIFIKLIDFHPIHNFEKFIELLLKLENIQTRTLLILSFVLTQVRTELRPAQPQHVLNIPP